MVDTAPNSLRRTDIGNVTLPDGAVLVDQLRARTRWSEGMFVTAQHFSRDQSYLMTRAGDLGQAIGRGVVEGLEVTAPTDDPTALVVAPGFGIAGGGESVVVHQPVRISLGDVSLQRILSQAAGLDQSLQRTPESRSGIFILCATPVEFTSNPVGNYGTAPDGNRRLEDSVINEATLLTLVEYASGGAEGAAQGRQAEAAAAIFAGRRALPVPETCLPLAMVELSGNVVVWLDQHLVRRDAGAARADAFSVGIVDTPTRIAHFRQYDEMIGGLLGRAFPAAQQFTLLPPMGRMPTACVSPRSPRQGVDPVLSQNWLPAEMPVELVALPEDEIEQILMESVTLPPIDLTAKTDALEQTPISIIIPVPRAEWADTPTEVTQATLTLAAAKPLGSKPRTPAALIDAILKQDQDEDLIDPTISAEWLALLRAQPFLWYARRRQFLRTDALTGEAYQYQVDPTVFPDTGNDAPVIDTGNDAPVDTTPLPAEDAAPYLVAFDTAIRTGLTPWGMSAAFERLSPGNTIGERPDKAALNEALGIAIGLGSPLIAADILFSFARDPRSVRTLGPFYAEREIQQVLLPNEGLLLGGNLDVEIPPFKASVDGPTVNGTTARALNFGISTAVPDPLINPDLITDGAPGFIESTAFSSAESEALLGTGGGTIHMRRPRNSDELNRIAILSLELEFPVIWRAREPGSVEAQTRRNLIAGTQRLPEIARAMTKRPLVEVMNAVANLHQALDRALSSSTASARDLANAGVRDLVAELER